MQGRGLWSRMWGVLFQNVRSYVAIVLTLWNFTSSPNSTTSTVIDNKLIRRWDSERELSLRDIEHAVQNTIDSCINSATDRRGYVLEHRFTKFSEITQCNGHYAVQGHSRSPILVPIKSSYTTSYQWLILTYLLSYTVSKLWLIIGQIFASESGVPYFNTINDISLKLDSLAYISVAESIGIYSTTFT